MTLTIDLSPEAEAKINWNAAQRGMSATDFARNLLESVILPQNDLQTLSMPDAADNLTQEEFAAYWSATAEDFTPENLGLHIPLATEESLRKIWDTPEEDAAWRDLQKAI